MLRTAEKNLSLLQLRELKRFGGRVNKFGVNFAVCDVNGELVLLCEGGKFQSNKKSVIDNCLLSIEESSKSEKRKTNQFLTTVLKSDGEAVGAALIDLGDDSSCVRPGACRDTQYDMRNMVFGEMLGLLAEKFQVDAKVEKEIEMVSTELSQTYEELVLLHKLGASMRVTEADANFLQTACDNLTGIVDVEGIAILLEKTIENEKQLILAAGSGLIDMDEEIMVILKNRLVEEMAGQHKEYYCRAFVGQR
jgi:hypothetical protein